MSALLESPELRDVPDVDTEETPPQIEAAKPKPIVQGSAVVLPEIELWPEAVNGADTLSKIAVALDISIAQFFADETVGHQVNPTNLSDDELRFLTQIRRYSSNLNESDRKLLLAMVKKFAATAVR